jgi:hypothetical protein
MRPFDDLRRLRGWRFTHKRSYAAGTYNQHKGARAWRLAREKTRVRLRKLKRDKSKAITFSKDGRYAIVPNLSNNGKHHEGFPMLSTNYKRPLTAATLRKKDRDSGKFVHVRNHVCLVYCALQDC